MSALEASGSQVGQPVPRLGFGYRREEEGINPVGALIGTAATAGVGSVAGSVVALIQKPNGKNVPLGVEIASTSIEANSLDDLVKNIKDNYVSSKAKVEDVAEVRTAKKALKPLKQAQEILQDSSNLTPEARNKAKKLADKAAKFMKEGTRP